MAHPERMAILLQLLDGDCNIAELSESLSMPATAVSNHLSRLRVEGLVDFTRYHRIIEIPPDFRRRGNDSADNPRFGKQTRGIVLKSFPFAV